MRVLLVEDDLSLASYLSEGLKSEGFVVEVTDSAIHALSMIKENLFGFVILDLFLRDINGYGCISEIRRVSTDIPIIVISSLSDAESRVKALNMGVDDFLVKPFLFIELVARVRSILRRANNINSAFTRYRHLRLDISKQKVYSRGNELNLTSHEFRLLAFFINNPGKVFSRTVLAEQVWSVLYDGDSNVIDVAISRLRKKMENNDAEKLLHSVRGVGYILE